MGLYISVDEVRTIKQCPIDKIGKKGANLLFAHEKSDCLIPPTLVITTDYFKTLLRINGIKDPYRFDWKKFRIPEADLNFIYNQITKAFGTKNVVVRSSATCEDNAALSFAGQYSTFLNLKSKKEIAKAILLCYMSLFSDNAKYYSEVNNIDLTKHSMAILIQPIIPVSKAGVIFTKNPINNKEEYLIETISGLGDKVVSGSVKPTLYKIDKQTKINKYPEYINSVVVWGGLLEKAFGRPQDIEWGIMDKKVYIFQSRPITTNFKIHSVPEKYSTSLYFKIGSGETSCPGIADGRLTIISSFKDYKKIKKGDILYFKGKMDIRIVSHFSKVRGIIGCGGILSHFSVLSREFGIPCLVEPCWSYKIKNGMSVFIDATEKNIFKSL